MAAHLWYRLNPDSISMLGMNGKALAVWSNGGVIEPKDPCSTGVPVS
jgi:hypothetical protein